MTVIAPHRWRGRIAALCLACLAGPGVADDPFSDVEHVRADGKWYRLSGGRTWRVNPTIVTVRLQDGHDLAGLIAKAKGPLGPLSVVRSNRLGYHDLRLPAGVDVMDAVAWLRRADDVAHVQENVFGVYVGATNDPRFAEQYALENTGQTGGADDADIDMPEAWLLQPGSPSIVIAVLDSGTNIDHEDLAPSMWKNTGEIAGNGLDDDDNGFIDDADGWDFFNDDPDPRGFISHGTQVAGVVGAVRNNGIGIAGVAGRDAEGAGCRIMPLGVGDFQPTTDAVDDAILYAMDNGARIITLSLEVPQTESLDATIAAAHAAGVFIDCAAGNNGSAVFYPANHPLVMAIGATDHLDNAASFTTPGPEVEVAAPGENVLTTSIAGYQTATGTSFSAPHVAGVAGLLLSAAPCLENDEIRAILCDTADDVDASGFDVDTGWGRINAHAALLHVTGLADLCSCFGDVDGDGSVGFADLLTLLAEWGPCPTCASDLDDDEEVGFSDLLLLLAAWDSCG